MKIRFLADANLNYRIVQATKRRQPDIDFHTATQAGLAGLEDPQVLALAAQDGRILVTHDRNTMPGHFASFIATRESPGVIIIPQDLAVLSAAEDLILMWAASEAEEWENRITYLPL